MFILNMMCLFIEILLFTVQSTTFSKNISKYEVVLAGTCPQIMSEETGNVEDK